MQIRIARIECEMEKKISIIMYHYIRDLRKSRYPKIKGLTVSEFRDQIEYFLSQGQIISPETLFEALESGNATKLGKNNFILTFDDGYIDHFTNVLPVLHRKKISAFFSMPGKIIAEKKLLDVNKIHFILAVANLSELKNDIFSQLDFYRGKEFDFPSNQELYEKLAIPSRLDNADTIFIKRLLQVELDERLRGMIIDNLFGKFISIPEDVFCQELYMSLDQVKMMKRMGMMFGIHGYDHTWMNRMSPATLAEDVDKALDIFSGIVDNSNWVCCYPYGSVSDTVVEIIRAKNAFAGLTSVVGSVDLMNFDIFYLSRYDTNDFPPKK